VKGEFALGAPAIWELVRSFKQECESQGWKTSAEEDWVYSDGEYHNFLWTRTIHPSTFRKIAKASKCAVRQGGSYQVVDVSYTAWLFSEQPPEELWRMLVDDQCLAEKTAVYDLSGLREGKLICVKCNQTKSKVFKEFENFLRRKLGSEFKTPRDMVTAEV